MMCSMSCTLIFMYMRMRLVQTFNVKFSDNLSDCNFL